MFPVIPLKWYHSCAGEKRSNAPHAEISLQWKNPRQLIKCQNYMLSYPIILRVRNAFVERARLLASRMRREGPNA